MAQRISRAKQSIKASGVPLRDADRRRARASGSRAVLHVLYLIFNEGYTASGGPALQRADLSNEAIRLARALHALAARTTREVAGLLALMLLTDARRAARTGPARRADSARRAGPRALGPRARSPRASRSLTATLPRGAVGRVPAPGGDRRGARRGRARRGHRLAADPRALRRARAHVRQPDGRAQPRDRGRDGARPGRRARRCSTRSTPIRASPATIASTPCARTCSSARAIATRRSCTTARRGEDQRAFPSATTCSRRRPRVTRGPKHGGNGETAESGVSGKSGSRCINDLVSPKADRPSSSSPRTLRLPPFPPYASVLRFPGVTGSD